MKNTTRTKYPSRHTGIQIYTEESDAHIPKQAWQTRRGRGPHKTFSHVVCKRVKQEEENSREYSVEISLTGNPECVSNQKYLLSRSIARIK